MKIVKINESQKKRIFEAYSEGFTFEKLSMLRGDWEKQYYYCCKWLGKPMGFGSSRCVFTLSDNMILKLAMGGFRDAGIAQNEFETKMFKKTESPLLARIYDAAKDYSYIVCENVVPAEEIDFEKLLGIPFMSYWKQTTSDDDDTIGFDKYFDGTKKHIEEHKGASVYDILCYIESNYVTNEQCFDYDIEKIINSNPWFKEFVKLVEDTNISDFCNVENFGIVNRNGKPMLVLLDAGMNLNLWYNFYDD